MLTLFYDLGKTYEKNFDRFIVVFLIQFNCTEVEFIVSLKAGKDGKIHLKFDMDIDCKNLCIFIRS